jgi:peptidyl-Lys metalloendopeptidase
VAPGPDDYVRIPAGESVSRQIDLSQNYAITEPGDYEASFVMPILGFVDAGDSEPPAGEGALQPALVKSPKASFRCDGVALTPPGIEPEALSDSPPSPAYSLPPNPKEPYFDGNFSDDQKGDYRLAHLAAYHRICTALESVERGVADSTYYSTWMETPLYPARWRPPYWRAGWEKRWETVKKNLRAMASWMSDRTIVYTTHDEASQCTFGVIAYTVFKSTAIHMCNLAFSNAFMRLFYRDSEAYARTSMLIHEISHAAASTKDTYYNYIMCKSLASDDPQSAVVNAENYAYFAMCWDDHPLPSLPPFGKTVALRASNGQWLRVRNDGQITADSASSDADENKFTVDNVGAYDVALKSLLTKKNVHVGLAPYVLTAGSNKEGWPETFAWRNVGGRLNLISLAVGRLGKFVSFDTNPDGSYKSSVPFAGRLHHKSCSE